jgi:hypothetical protein
VHIDISSRVASLQSLKQHWISRESSFYAALLQASEVGTCNSSGAALVGISFFLWGGEQYVLACELQVIMSSAFR